MTRHRVLVGVAILLASLVVTTDYTQAKEHLRFDSAQYKGSKGIVFMKREDLLRMATRFGLKVHTVKVSKRDLGRLAKMPSTGCGCGDWAPIEGEGESGGNCFKDCLSDLGVGYGSLVGCLAVCGLATGAPPGIAACVSCLGVGEWIVAGCALYCVWSPLLGNNHSGAPLRHNLRSSPTPRTQVARLSPRDPTRSASLR